MVDIVNQKFQLFLGNRPEGRYCLSGDATLCENGYITFFTNHSLFLVPYFLMLQLVFQCILMVSMNFIIKENIHI